MTTRRTINRYAYPSVTKPLCCPERQQSVPVNPKMSFRLEPCPGCERRGLRWQRTRYLDGTTECRFCRRVESQAFFNAVTKPVLIGVLVVSALVLFGAACFGQTPPPVRTIDPAPSAGPLAMAARRDYAISFNLTNVLAAEQQLRIVGFDGKTPVSLRYCLMYEAWRSNEMRGKPVVYTYGKADIEIRPRRGGTAMAGDYASGGTAVLYIDNSFVWSFTGFMNGPLGHELHHWFKNAGTPNCFLDNNCRVSQTQRFHTAEPRSIVSCYPYTRYTLDRGPDKHGLVWGMMPSEAAGERAVVQSR